MRLPAGGAAYADRLLSLVRAAEACPVGTPSGVVAALAALSSAVGGTRPLLSSGARAASHLGGSRVCVRRCDVPAREHARRRGIERKRAWAFVRFACYGAWPNEPSALVKPKT